VVKPLRGGSPPQEGRIIMKASTRRSPGRRWLCFAVTCALIVASQLLQGGSAQAASTHPRPLGTATVATASGATGGTVFTGFTSQDFPSFFTVSSNARTLTVAAIAYEMTCVSGDEFGDPDEFTHVPIQANGKFHVNLTLPPTSAADGATFSGTDSLKGILNRKHSKVSGVWELHLNYAFPNGMTDQCDSGPVRFVDAG
jgi:hypothetical protein